MKSKISKGFCTLAMVLLSAGAFCFIPAFVKSSQPEAAASELSDGGYVSKDEAISSAKGQQWSDGAFSQLDLSTQTYNGQEVYTISSAGDLAFLSRMVKEGNASYMSASYLVTVSNINLGGQLWTPIGTLTNPFQGKFYGNYVTISNIWVTNESLGELGSAYGLFGNVAGNALISDVNVSGFDAINSTPNSGVLVGKMTGGKITNCHDLRTYKNTDGAVVTINGNTDAKIYYGGTTNGKSASYTSAADAKASVVVNGLTEGGYVAKYHLTDGTFRMGASDTRTDLKDIDVAVSATGAIIAGDNAIYNTYAKNFSAALPTLRETSTELYTYRPGYKATIPALSWNSGFVSNITWQHPSVTLTYDVGYGTQNQARPINGYFYDYTVAEAWAEQSIARPGYTFEGLYRDQAFATAAADDYIYANKTLYVKWNSTEINASLYLGISDAQGLELANKADKPLVLTSSNVSSAGEFGFSDKMAVEESQKASSFARYDVTNYTTGSTLKFTIPLKEGFAIPTGEGIVTSSQALGSELRDVAGVYIAGTFDQNNMPTYIVEKNTGNVYTITVENIVDNNSAIGIVIEREEIEVKVNISGDEGQVVLSSNPQLPTTGEKTIIIKTGDSLVITAEAQEYFFLNNVAATNVKEGTLTTEMKQVEGANPDTTVFRKTKSAKIEPIAEDYGYFYPLTAQKNSDGKIEVVFSMSVDAIELIVNVNQVAVSGHDYGDYYVGFSTGNIGGSGTINGDITANLTKEGLVLYIVSNEYYEYYEGSAYCTNANLKSVEKVSTSTSQAYKFVITGYSDNPTKENKVFLNYGIKSIDYTLNLKATVNGKEANVDKFVDFSKQISGLYIGQEVTYTYTLKTSAGNLGNLVRMTELNGSTDVPTQAAGVYTGKYTFTIGDVQNGATIVANFEAYEITLNFIANEAKLDNGSGSQDLTGNLQNAGALKVVLNPENSGLVFDGTYNFGQTYLGYTFKGWYLRNGNVSLIESGTGTRDKLLEYIQGESFVSNVSGTTSLNIMPIYQSKAINIAAAHDAVEDGFEGLYSIDGGLNWGNLRNVEVETLLYKHDLSSKEIDGILQSFRRAGFDIASIWAAEGDNEGVSAGVQNDKVNITFGTDFHNSWSGKSEKSIVLVPTFSNALGFVFNSGEEKGSLKVLNGATISFNAANYTYSSGLSSFITSSKNGHEAVGFTLSGGLANGQYTCVDGTASFTIDDAFIKQYVAAENYLNVNTFTLTTVYSPVTYTITLGYDANYENVTLASLTQNVVFGQTADLSNFVAEGKVLRDGYKLVGLREKDGSKVEYATLGESGFEFALFNPADAKNTTVYPVWERAENYNYINVDIDAPILYYNEKEQTLLTGKLIVNGVEVESFNTSTIFRNGEKIKEFSINNLSGKTAKAKDVGENAWTFKVVVIDSLSLERFGSENGKELPKTVTTGIKANPVILSGLKLESYYTGSSELDLTDAEQTYGTFAFTHVTGDEVPAIAQNLLSYKVVDEKGLFDAGKSYSVKVLADITAAQAANYGITEKEGTLYVVAVIEDGVTIVPLVINFELNENQKGFKIQNQTHKIAVKDVYFNSELISVNYSYLRTNSAEVGVYNSVDNIVIEELSVLKDGQTLNPTNYTIIFTNDYKIVEFSGSNHVIGPRYLTASNGELVLNGGNLQGLPQGSVWSYNISFVYNGESVAVTNPEQYTFAPEGQLVFTMFAAPNGDLKIAKAENTGDVNFIITLVGEFGELTLVDFDRKENIISENEYVGKLNNFAQAASPTLSTSIGNADTQIWAVFSDVKRVNVYYNINNELVNDTTRVDHSFYIKKDEVYTFANDVTKTGFDFAMFKVEGEIQVEGKVFTGGEGHKVAKAIMLWDMKEFEYQILVSEERFKYAGHGPIKHDYDYWKATNYVSATKEVTWIKFDDEGNETIFGTGPDILLRYNYADSGKFKLKTKFTYNDPNDARGEQVRQGEMQFERILEFTIKDRMEIVFKVDDVEQDRLAYTGKSLHENIFLKFLYKEPNPTPIVPISLEQCFSDLGREWYEIEIKRNGEVVSSVRQAGQYEISCKLIMLETGDRFDPEVLTATFTIDKFEYSITDSDVAGKLSVYYGQEKNSLSIDVYVAQTDETISVEFLKAAEGSNVGNYKAALAEKTYDNYIFNLTNENNDYWQIVQSTETLFITVEDTSLLTKVYNKEGVSIIPKLIDGKWVLEITDTQGLNKQASLKLQTASSGSYTDFEAGAEAYNTVFNGVSFSIGEVVNAGKYAINISKEGSTGFNTYAFAAETSFVIEKKTVDVLSAEKMYDRTKSISGATIIFDGVVGGDVLSIVGNFASAQAGENIILENIELASDNEANKNYQLGTIGNGKISPSKSPVEMTFAGDLIFEYGQLNLGMTLAQVEALIGSPTIAIGGENLSDELNQIDKIVLAFAGFKEGSTFSKGNYLNAAPTALVFTLTSANYNSLAEGKVWSFNIVINKKALDAKGNTGIIKEYDTTSSLPADTNLVFDGVLAGDEVLVGGDTAFLDAKVGKDKLIKIVLDGADKANYTLVESDMPKGEITRATVTVVIDAEAKLGHSDITLADGENIVNINNGVYTFGYDPEEKSVEGGNYLIAAFNSLNKPTRKGFTVTGFSFGEAALTSDNLLDVLAAAFRAADKSATIYAQWQINNISITIEKPEDFEIVVKNGGSVVEATEENGNIYVVEYYSSLTIDFTAAEGRKLQNVTLPQVPDFKAEFSGAIGKNAASISLDKIKSSSTIGFVDTDIIITISFDINKPEFADQVSVVGQGWGNGVKSANYNDIKATLTENYMPSLQTTAGTYNHIGWTYGENISANGKTLAEVLGSVVEDKSITLVATWEGQEYTIVFMNEEAQAGTLEGVRFGSQIGGTFPSIEIPGKVQIWVNEDGDVFEPTTVLKEVGKYADGKWTYTLFTRYASRIYDLKIESSGLELLVNGQALTDDGIYKIEYQKNSVRIVVTADEGYGFKYDFDGDEDHELTVEGNVIVIENIVDNRTISLVAEPKENTLKLELTNAKVLIDGNKVSEIKAKTGEVATFIIKADEGYELATDIVTLSGRGKVNTKLTAGGDLEVTWLDFTGNATLKLAALARNNAFTFADGLSVVDYIMVNGVKYNVDEKPTVKTGVEARIVVVLKYGYENATLTNSGITIDSSSEEIKDPNTWTFSKEFVVTKFVSDTSLSISAQARSYLVKVQAGENGLVANGSDNVASYEFNITFGASTTLTAVPDESYMLQAWINGETTLASSESFTFEANDQNRAILENLEDGKVVVSAVFDLAAKNVIITSVSKGSIAYGDVQVTEGNSATVKANFGETFVLKLKPYEGYEATLDTIKFYKDGSQISFTADFDPSENTISFVLTAASPDKIEVDFVAADAYVTVQAVLQLLQTRNYGNGAGGKVYLTDSEYNRLANSAYLQPVTEGNGAASTAQVGVDYRYKTKTDSKLYFEAEVKTGYTFVIDASSSYLTIKEISRTPATGNLKEIVRFEVSGVRDKAEIYGAFISTAQQVSLSFKDADGNSLPAGYIVVETKDNLVSIDNNNSANVIISAMANEHVSINVKVRTNFNFAFVRDANNMPILENADEKFVTTAINDIAFDGTKGYLEEFELVIENPTEYYEILIKVEPKKYQVVFKDGQTIVGTTTALYGKKFDLPDEVREQILGNARANISFQGYFTYERGDGIKYVDNSAVIMSEWFETGYIWREGRYAQATNFVPSVDADSEFDGQFFLYASWLMDKEKITIDFIPQALKDKADIRITDIIVGLTENTYWTNVEDKFYADIITGTRIDIEAYQFEGYTFKEWRIKREGQPDEIIALPNFNYVCGKDVVTIEAVYFVNFNLIFENDGGTVWLVQDGQNLGSEGCIDSTKPFMLMAKANKGYNFDKWYQLDGTAYGKGESRQEGEDIIWYMTCNDLRSESFAYKAVFKGDAINVVIDKSLVTIEGKDRVSISKIFVNGEERLSLDSFTANVGDEITLHASSTYGYGIVWEGLNFIRVPSEGSDYGVYKYTILAQDLTQVSGSQTPTLIIKPKPDPTSLKLIFKVTIEKNQFMEEKAGSLSYNGSEVVNNTEIENIRFGEVISIRVNLAKNYDIDSVSIGKLVLNFAEMGSGFNKTQGEIIIQTSILENIGLRPQENSSVQVSINFTRIVWTDVRSNGLSGSGTQNDPYIIASEEDFAYMAYMINQEKNEEFANAYFRLTRSLDLSGKFWEPIGVEDNPFNGVFDMGPYTVDNIEHYQAYSNPSTSHNGMFRFMGENAKVLTSDNTLIIALSISGGVLLLILLLILILLLVRRSKKKKMEELANS